MNTKTHPNIVCIYNATLCYSYICYTTIVFVFYYPTNTATPWIQRPGGLTIRYDSNAVIIYTCMQWHFRLSLLWLESTCSAEQLRNRHKNEYIILNLVAPPSLSLSLLLLPLLLSPPLSFPPLPSPLLSSRAMKTDQDGRRQQSDGELPAGGSSGGGTPDNLTGDGRGEEEGEMAILMSTGAQTTTMLYLHHLVLLKLTKPPLLSTTSTAPLISTSSITVSSSLFVTGPTKLHQPHSQGIPSPLPLPTSSTMPTSSPRKATKEDGCKEVGKWLVQEHIHVLVTLVCMCMICEWSVEAKQKSLISRLTCTLCTCNYVDYCCLVLSTSPRSM